MSNHHKKTSQFLSYVLRHEPQSIGIALDSEGWVNIDTLIAQANIHHQKLNKPDLLAIVANSDKKRFTLSPDGLLIRAAQGHSSQQVAINHTITTPPAILYHGTTSRFIDSIKQQGLLPQSRHHVHLSADTVTAQKVGERHGKVVILSIDTQAMLDAGYLFYQADNGVWLCDKVPSQFIQWNELPSSSTHTY